MQTYLLELLGFVLLQFATARAFAGAMPERMVTHRGLVQQNTYIPKRFALWIGPALALLIGLLGLIGVGSVRSPGSLLLIQIVVYVVMLYMYVLNLVLGRRGHGKEV